MSTSRSQADVESLRKLLLGQLPVAEVERLAAELADDSRIAELAESLANRNDTLIDSLRQHETMSDPQADQLVGRIVERLKKANDSNGPFNDTLGLSGNDESSEPPIPEKLEYFAIQKVLGQGGMGTVYLADDTRLGRQVAIKTLKRELAANPAAKDRFLREARTAAKLHHDHIIPIYCVGESDGIPFLAMPFLEGEPLDTRIKRQMPSDPTASNYFEQLSGNSKPLPIPDAIRIAREVAQGLAVAHKQGLIHRDIKPANIWLEAPNGRVKILDFGLARSQTEAAQLTASGAIMGTPAYMAPEQARGKQVDARADLFSLGCVLYEMTTGQRPFRGEDTMAILSSLALDNPEPPHKLNPKCPPALSELTMQLLAKDPAHRPASADVVVGRLAKLAMPVVEMIDRTVITPPSNDPWAHLEDLSEVPMATAAEPEASARANQSRKRERRAAEVGSPKRKQGKIGSLLAVAVVLLILIGVGFAGYKLFFETKDGTLVVEVVGDADVRFKNGELHIYDAVGKTLKYKLKPSERNKKLPPGEYKVTVVGADGLELDTDKFEIKQGGDRIVRVIAKAPAIVVKKDVEKPKLSNDADRRAAEWAIRFGAELFIGAEGRGDLFIVQRIADLPAQRYWVESVSLQSSTKLRDEDLDNLKRCSVQRLNLQHTDVSDASMETIASLPQLWSLLLSRSKVTDKGVDKLKNLRLKQLSVGPDITGASLKYLQGMPLEYLALSQTKLMDADLDLLLSIKSLKWVALNSSRIGKRISFIRRLNLNPLKAILFSELLLGLEKNALVWIDAYFNTRFEQGGDQRPDTFARRLRFDDAAVPLDLALR